MGPARPLRSSTLTTIPTSSIVTDPNFGTSDLAVFDQTFGLPDPPSFTKYNQSGQTTNLPGTDPSAGSGNGDWEMEEALDIEWAHAIAPGASIDLVEANSDSDPNNRPVHGGGDGGEPPRRVGRVDELGARRGTRANTPTTAHSPRRVGIKG